MKKASFDIRIFFDAFLEFVSLSQFLRLPSPSGQLSGGAPELAEVKKTSFDIRIFFAAFLEFFSLSQFLRLPSPSGQLSGGAPELAEVKKASFDIRIFFAAFLEFFLSKPISKASLSLRPALRRRARAS